MYRVSVLGGTVYAIPLQEGLDYPEDIDNIEYLLIDSPVILVKDLDFLSQIGLKVDKVLDAT